MNMMDLGNQLKDTVVKITAIKNNDTVIQSTGTVYTYKENDKIIPLILVDYNKFNNIKTGVITFNTHNNGEKNDSIKVNFDQTIIKKLGRLDIGVIPIASVINKIPNLYYKSIDEEITLDRDKLEMLMGIEDVIYMGFAEGIDNMPIVKKSITSTPIEDNVIFYIDTKINKGMSGSPVFICNQGMYPIANGMAMGNRILFVGIIEESILPDRYTKHELTRVINSYIIKDEIKTLVKNI